MTNKINYKSHYCCFEQENPPCGLKGKHRCCICEAPVPNKINNWSDEFDEKFLQDFDMEIVSWADEEPSVDEIKSFISKTLKEQVKEIEGEMEGLRKKGMNGEGLPFENSPEIYGNQRIESYKKGYNTALSDVLSILKKHQ